MKKKIHNFINENSYFLNFIYALIILNVISIILESYQGLRLEYGDKFHYFEVFSVAIFTIEYLLRLWTASEEYKDGNSFSKRIQFIFSKFGIIDFLSILPFYLPFFVILDLRVLRILRLFRLLRIFKLARFSKSMKTIGSVLKETKADLIITFFVAFVLLIISSTLMYYAETEAQPEKFNSIGDAMWWGVATLTTVGYGDVYPITGLGKFLSGIIALIGIGFVALPTGIISSAFVDKIQKTKSKKKCTCPSCGEVFEA